jgi:hypothetical protein
MPLRRSPEQKRQSLDEFYAEVEGWDDPGSSRGGAQMRQIIKRLDAEFSSTDIWGLTSHVHLLLQASSEYAAPWFVSVVCYADQVVVEYRLPAHEAPWKDAVVRGVTTDVETSVAYIRSAMIRSRGWPQSRELRSGEPGASPSGGPATQLGNSGVGEGPPSVS